MQRCATCNEHIQGMCSLVTAVHPCCSPMLMDLAPPRRDCPWGASTGRVVWRGHVVREHGHERVVDHL